jgi:hypothetical protein
VQQPRFAKDPRERLLYEVLGFLPGAAEAPRGSIQPIDVVA